MKNTSPRLEKSNGTRWTVFTSLEDVTTARPLEWDSGGTRIKSPGRTGDYLFPGWAATRNALRGSPTSELKPAMLSPGEFTWVLGPRAGGAGLPRAPPAGGYRMADDLFNSIPLSSIAFGFIRQVHPSGCDTIPKRGGDG